MKYFNFVLNSHEVFVLLWVFRYHLPSLPLWGLESEYKI